MRTVPGRLLYFLLLVLASCDGRHKDQNAVTDERSAATQIGSPGQLTLAPLVKRAAPAVVSIAVLQASPAQQNPMFRDPFYRRYFGIPDSAVQPRLAAGSGVIVEGGRGLVLTNHHVVDNARAIEVTLTDRRRFEAELVGSDEPTDIAVLKIKGVKLPQLALGDSNALQVGDHVIAIGNPFGLGQTVTAGIVSALGRGLTEKGYESYIQTDAPINPGNSGGPLIGLDGTVMGINSAIYGPGANVGIGFAVPAASVRFVMNQILVHGAVRRGQIGVAIKETIAPLGAPEAPAEGALIAAMAPRSAAAAAGLRIGDVVVAADGRPTPTATSLRNAVGLTEIGKHLKLTVQRGTERFDVSVEIRP